MITEYLPTNDEIKSHERRFARAPSFLRGSAVVGKGTYKIQVEYLSTVTSVQKAAFDSAAAKWGSMILTKLPDLPAQQAVICGESRNIPIIDDLLIYATIKKIDGPGGVLGQAGPCNFLNGYSRVGEMLFDVDDVAMLIKNNAFVAVILHEMGHVLGIGTLWENFLYIGNQTDPRFTGKNAVLGMQSLPSDANHSFGNSIPADNTRPGSYGAHWRESVFGNELMTGYLGSGVEPISLMTLRSLQDIGYAVDLQSADAYTIPATGTDYGTNDIPVSTPPIDNISSGGLGFWLVIIIMVAALAVVYIVSVIIRASTRKPPIQTSRANPPLEQQPSIVIENSRQEVRQAPPEDWTCPACTFNNPSIHKSCLVCGTESHMLVQL